jgi:hypothetical protein
MMVADLRQSRISFEMARAAGSTRHRDEKAVRGCVPNRLSLKMVMTIARSIEEAVR